MATRRAPGPLAPGASRFGGAPDVPPDFAWPVWKGRALTFLAQLDLAELAAPALPTSGWLLFFYDASEQPWGFDPADAGCARVMFVPGPRERLAPRQPPEVPSGAIAFRTCAVRFTSGLELPDLDDRVVEAATLRIEEVHRERYGALAAHLSGSRDRAPCHHLLGHPQALQHEMRGECQLVTNGIYLGDGRDGGHRSERAKALLRSAASEWQLLLQIDTDDGDEGPGWMWGDCGRIYFWILRTDLAARAFDRVWLILQC